MSDIIFPTDTKEIPSIKDDDRLIIADSGDVDMSKDVAMSDLALYVGEELQGTGVGLPTATTEGEMLVVNASLEWVPLETINLGTY